MYRLQKLYIKLKNYTFKSDPYYLLILGLVALSLVGLIVYILVDKTPPHWDAGRHFYNSRQYFDYLKYVFRDVPGKLNVEVLAISRLLTGYYYYPPFFYYSTIPFLVFFGKTYQAALAVNVVWLALLIASIYKYLKLLKFSNFAIIFGFGVILGSPFIIGQSREYQLDFPNLTMVFFLLWRLEAITIKRDSVNFILLCLAVSIGPLVKWHFILHSSVVIIFYCVRWLNIWRFKFKDLDWGYYSTLMFSILTSGISISGMWYISNLLQLKLDLTKNATQAGIAEGDPQGFTIETYKTITRYFTTYYFNLPWFIFFIALGLIVLGLIIYNRIKKKNINFQKVPHLFALSFSVVLFVSMLVYHINQSNKDPRYMIIMYISFVLWMSLVGEFIFANIKNKIIQNSILSILLVIFGLNFISLTWSNEAKAITAFQESDIPIIVINNSGYTNPRLNTNQWAIYDALERAYQEKAPYYGDSCTIDNYFRLKPTIQPDFSPNTLHTSYGTVWGLAEQYDMTIANSSDSCFILVQRFENSKEAGVEKYVNPEIVATETEETQPLIIKYEFVETFEDFQGVEISLFKKFIDQ